MVQLRRSLPPLAHELRVWVLHTSADLRALRTALHHALTRHPHLAGENLVDVSERIELVATELATNAIKYGRAPTSVRLSYSSDELLLDVADHDPQTTPGLADNRPAGPGGLGLMLAQSFSRDVGWYTTETTKHVWASFPRSHDPSTGSHAQSS